MIPRYLEYAADIICEFLRSRNVSEVLFVPYALRKQDEYAATARKAFQGWGFKLTSIHETESPAEAARSAQVRVLTLNGTLEL